MAHQTTIVTRTQRDSSAGSPFPSAFVKLKKASCPIQGLSSPPKIRKSCVLSWFWPSPPPDLHFGVPPCITFFLGIF